MTENTLQETIKDFPKNQDEFPFTTRCFKTNAGETVFAIMISETEDSFLVGAPSKLSSNEDNSFSSIPLSPKGYVRIFKNSLFFVTEVTDLYKYWYFKYLLSNAGGRKVIPEIMSDVVSAEVLAYTRKFQLENSDVVEVIQSEGDGSGFPMPVPESLAERYEKLGITGISNEAFEPTIEKLSIH